MRFKDKVKVFRQIMKGSSYCCFTITKDFQTELNTNINPNYIEDMFLIIEELFNISESNRALKEAKDLLNG